MFSNTRYRPSINDNLWEFQTFSPRTNILLDNRSARIFNSGQLAVFQRFYGIFQL